MRRALWRWRGITIHSYPVMLYLGLVFGILAGDVAARAAGLDVRRVQVATLVLLVPALVGARLFFVATHWPLYRHDWRRIWRRSEGGAAMYGGFLLALPCSVPVLAVVGVEFGAFWDVATFTILVGMVFARVGCLLNGCCGGRPTSGRLGLRLPDVRGDWRPRVPTQLLEMGFGAAILCGGVLLWSRMPFAGGLLLYLMVSYGAARWLLEFARETPERLNIAMSSATLLLGVVGFVVARHA